MAKELFGIKGKTDEHGIASITVSWKVDTILEAVVQPLPDPSGLALPEALGKRTFEAWRGGGFLVNASYDGAVGGQIQTTYPDGLEFQWEFDSSFAEQRIEKHPNIKALIRKYGGRVEEDGTIVWPLELPTANAGGGGFGGSNIVTDPNGKSPMFGNQTYPEWMAVFRMTRAVKTIPPDILTRIGKTHANLPVPGPLTPQGRDWLVMPPKLSRAGNVYRLMDEWLISPAGGPWPADIREFIR
jgi:hypothetical protein